MDPEDAGTRILRRTHLKHDPHSGIDVGCRASAPAAERRQRSQE